MKTLPLFCVTALTISSLVHAGPVFDIPRIDGVTIDGKAGDWGEKGFRVETLAGQSGEVRQPQDFDAQFRLGWDESGLLVLVTVHEKEISEADKAADLFKKDSVEMFLGASPGSPQYFQVVAGTGADPKFPSLRTFIRDLRKPAPPREIEVQAAATRTPDGYQFEARLPWSNLGIAPEPGRGVALQLCVNDVDESGARLSVTWFPASDTSRNPNSMFRLRLAANASPPFRTATRLALYGGRPLANIIGPADLAGKTAAATAENGIYSTGRFESDSGRARAALFLPPASSVISYEGGASAIVDSNDVNTLISKAIEDVHLAFRPCVFNGEKFPKCDFEPSDAASALGKCVITTTFYDADYREVTTPSGPGRYGAIIQVKTRTGQTFKRFATLYRTAGDIDWHLTNIQLGRVDFPPGLGLNAATVAKRSKDLENFFKSQVREGMSHSDDAAILFAGLSELKPGGEPPTARNGPYAASLKWLYGLKKQTGNLRSDYYLHLPASYGSDRQKKWPLILFLHGSGERGYDINEVKANGLPHNLDDQPDFPFIVVAPQCPPDEWWSAFELNDLLDRVEAKYRVDTDRVYLTGLSMGGFGSWDLAIESPERFAAVAPVCGGGDPADVARIKDIPVWVFHGAKDQTVPIRRSQEMVDALKKAGGNVKFTIFPDAGHDSWTQAYAMPELYDWLLKQHRDGPGK